MWVNLFPQLGGSCVHNKWDGAVQIANDRGHLQECAYTGGEM